MCSPSAARSRRWSSGRSSAARPGGRSAGAAGAPASRSAAASRSRASPPIRSVSTFESARGVYSFSVGFAGQACTRPAAGEEELRARVAEDRVVRCSARREVALAARASACPTAAISPQTNASREGEIGEQRLEPEPARVAVRGREPGAQGHRRRERRGLRRRLHQPVEGGDPHVALLDRQEPAPVGQVAAVCRSATRRDRRCACCRCRPSHRGAA